jgi:hypothetical protein
VLAVTEPAFEVTSTARFGDVPPERMRASSASEDRRGSGTQSVDRARSMYEPERCSGRPFCVASNWHLSMPQSRQTRLLTQLRKGRGSGDYEGCRPSCPPAGYGAREPLWLTSGVGNRSRSRDAQSEPADRDQAAA